MSVSHSYTPKEKIAAFLDTPRRLWFIGIGGIHMAALAQMAKALGHEVSGSDTGDSEEIKALEKQGFYIEHIHRKEQIENAEAAVYTLAISPENPEYLAAQKRGLPLFSRAEFLGALMLRYPIRVGVAGSHGKSTVTAMLADILEGAGLSPTVLCGARMWQNGASFRGGTGKICLFEACEYMRSFLAFSPTISVVLNISLDHVDYFTDQTDLEDAFCHFLSLPPQEGAVLAEQKTLHAMEKKWDFRAPVHTFSTGKGGEYRGVDASNENGAWQFTFLAPNRKPQKVRLKVLGAHNIINAVAALAAADLCGVPPAVSVPLLESFRGVHRRLEWKGTLSGATVLDDYAHHPEEIAAGIKAAREVAKGGRVFAVFQPHTYSRTAAFWREFQMALSAADRVFLVKIYGAREEEQEGISSRRMAAEMGEKARYFEDWQQLSRTLTAELQKGDVLLIMGAGNIDGLFREFSEKDFTSAGK